MSTTPDLPDDVARFVAEVRAHLDDLPPEQVDELTDGLEADLAEGLADDDGGAQRMGDAAAFAAELRAAADLPRRDPDGDGRPARPPLRRRGTALARRIAARMGSSSLGRWIVGLAVLLRPAWWVLRAVVAVGVLASLLLAGTPAALLVAVLILPFAIYGSVELGRGRWAFPWRRAAVVAGNLATGISAVFLALALLAGSTASAPFETVVTGTPIDGACLNGDGRSVRDGRLLGQDGNPVTMDKAERARAVKDSAAELRLCPRARGDSSSRPSPP
jgi:hypothetical protein